MVKKMFILLLVGAVVLLCGQTSLKAGASEADERVHEYSERIESRMAEAIDDDTRALMEENGAEKGDISGLTPGKAAAALWREICSSAAEPIKTAGRLTAVLILTALIKCFCKGSLLQGASVISVLAGITVIYRSVYGAFSNVCAFLDKLSAFMLSYIPIYASVTAASGGFTAGGSYYASTIGICELIGLASRNVIMPFLSLFMALSFTAAINPDMHFAEAAASVKNTVKIVLTALMTVFTGLVSLKSITGSAADSAASKIARFGASSFIPIIGSSVSEAYSTVYAGVGVIRSAVGTAGIAAAGFMLIRPIAELILVKAVLGAGCIISDMLGLSEQSEFLRSMGYSMSAAISTVLCFSMMFIISTAVLMLTAADSL